MYMELTVKLKDEDQSIDLRMSDQKTIHQLVQVTWKLLEVKRQPKDGGWVRIVNKQKVISGVLTLEESGVTSGDLIEIL